MKRISDKLIARWIAHNCQGCRTKSKIFHEIGKPVADAQLQADREEAKIVVHNLFEEIICPMCYRLNPQHATMNNGEGCHYCQEREDWESPYKEVLG